MWMIGTYLLLHCEAEAYRRNLSGELLMQAIETLLDR